MKTISILLLTLLIIPAHAKPPVGKARGKGMVPRGNGPKFEERAAMREEALLDHRDTHKWKSDPAAADKRPENLGEYSNHTYQRIVRLLHHGAITEADGKEFKETHTEIVTDGKSMRADGELSSEEKTRIRGWLDALNDDINLAITDAEKGDERSPILNHAQHRFEEQIEFGERSGRLSNAEASRLKRMVKKLADLEDREKEGGLTTREREKLFEEVQEIARDLREELND